MEDGYLAGQSSGRPSMMSSGSDGVSGRHTGQSSDGYDSARPSYPYSSGLSSNIHSDHPSTEQSSNESSDQNGTGVTPGGLDTSFRSPLTPRQINPGRSPFPPRSALSAVHAEEPDSAQIVDPKKKSGLL